MAGRPAAADFFWSIVVTTNHDEDHQVVAAAPNPGIAIEE
jgi:hypothetical protein